MACFRVMNVSVDVSNITAILLQLKDKSGRNLQEIMVCVPHQET